MGVSKAKKHSNDAQKKSNSGKANNSTEDKASQDKSKDHHNGKKVQQSVLEQQVWLEAQQVKVLLPLQNHMPLIMQVKTMMNMTIMIEIKNVKGGMAKVLLPLIAAVLIIGALAIFGGMALNNHNNGTKENKIANTNKNNADESKDKDTSKDASKDKSKSTDSDKSKMIKTKRLKMNLIMIKTTLINRTTKHKIIKINNKLIKINNSNNNNNVKVVAKDIQ